MKNFDFEYWGHYGVTDFYDETEATLREAIDSGEFFDTGWHGSAKEFETARICRNEDGITVSVYSDGIDDLFDSIGYSLSFLTEKEYEMLTDDMLSEIDECLMGNAGYSEEVTYDKTLPRNASFDDVVDTIDDLVRECNDTLEKSFECIIWTTLYILYGKPEDVEFINERIPKEA